MSEKETKSGFTATNRVTGEKRLLSYDDWQSTLKETDDKGRHKWDISTDALGVDPNTGERRFFNAAELHGAAQAGINPFADRTKALSAAAGIEVQKQRQAMAEDATGTAFLMGVGEATGIAKPIARAIATDGSEEQAQEFNQTVAEAEAANPFATGTGQLLGTAATLLGPGAINAAVTGTSMTATGLLGLSGRAGAAIEGRLASVVGQRAAKLAGKVGADLTTDAAFSLAFRAADAVDGDKPFSAGAFMQDVGTDLLIAGGLNLVGPAAKLAVKSKFLPINAVRAMAGKGPLGAVSNKLFGSSAGRIVNSGILGKAQKMALGEIDDAVRMSVDDLAKLGSVGAKETAERVAARASMEAVEASADWQLVRNAADDLANLKPRFAGHAERAVKEMKGLKSAATITSKEALSSVPDTVYSASRPGTNLHAIAALEETLPSIKQYSGPLKDVKAAIGSLKSASPKKTAEILTELQIKLLKGADSNIGNTGTAVSTMIADSRIAGIMQDASIWGQKAAEAHQAVGGLSEALRGIRNIVDETPTLSASKMAGKLKGASVAADALDDLRSAHGASAAALERARAAGLAIPAKLETSSAGLAKLLDDITPDVEVASAVNRVRAAETQRLAKGPKFAFIDNFAPGTQEAKAEMLMAAYDANRNFLTKVADGVENVAQVVEGALNKAYTGLKATTKTASYGVMAYRSLPSEQDKREVFNALSSALHGQAMDPFGFADQLGGATEKMNSADPEMASSISAQASNAMFYLESTLPTAEVDPWGDPLYEVPISQVETWLERWGAVEDVTSLLDAVAEGTLTEEAVEAASMCCPELLQEMQSSLVQRLGELKAGGKDIPTAIRTSTSILLGGGFDPYADPQFLLDLQNQGAQTTAQEQAIRTPSRRMPSMVEGHQTALDRQQNL